MRSPSGRWEATPVGSALGGGGGEERRGLWGGQPAVCHSGFYKPDHVLTVPREGAVLIRDCVAEEVELSE